MNSDNELCPKISGSFDVFSTCQVEGDRGPFSSPQHKGDFGVDDRFQREPARPHAGGCVLAQARPDPYELLSDLIEVSLSSKDQND